MPKRGWPGLLCVLALWMPGALASPGPTQTPLQRPVQRVVSLLPSLTETVCVLGACDRLVGVDRYSNWPAQVRKLPRMGGGLDPDLEAVVSARPDLVLMASSSRAATRLQSLGLRVLQLEPANWADARRDLLAVASVLGVDRHQAEAVWQGLLGEVQAARQQLDARARGYRVYVEVSPAPYGASETSFIGETLAALGVANILPASMGPFPKVNPEWVVRAQPDVIILGDSARSAAMARPGWHKMAAVRAGRICAFQAEQADALVRAGPRLGEGANLLVDCLNRAARTQAVAP